MADNTLTAIDDALFVAYKSGKLTRMAYKDHPFMATVGKTKRFPGKSVPIVTWFANTAGRSRTFATGQANASAEQVEQFNLTRKKDYGFAYIEMEALLVTQDDEASFLKLGTDAVEGTNRVVSRNMALSLYRNHGGARGRISAINSGVLTLTNPGDIVAFEKGMKVRHAQTDGTSGSLEAEAAVEITGVDRQAGTILASAWTGFDVGNYLFAEGDFGLSFNGIDSWIPSSVSVGENFLGADRSQDSRLRGLYLDAASNGYDYSEALMEADALLAREGASPDVVYMNPLDRRIFKSQLGSHIEYDMVGSPDMASITFNAIVMPSEGGAGQLKVLSDPDCPQGYAYMLQLDSWDLKTVGEFPRGLEGNGFKFITQLTSDKVEVRVGGYGNLACFAPSYNARIKLV